MCSHFFMAASSKLSLSFLCLAGWSGLDTNFLPDLHSKKEQKKVTMLQLRQTKSNQLFYKQYLYMLSCKKQTNYTTELVYWVKMYKTVSNWKLYTGVETHSVRDTGQPSSLKIGHFLRGYPIQSVLNCAAAASTSTRQTGQILTKKDCKKLSGIPLIEISVESIWVGLGLA